MNLSVGVHTLMLTFTDDDGTTDTDKVNITINPPAPSGVLDDFDRGDGGIGANWSGDTGDFSITSNQLVAVGGQITTILWNATLFGADQEAIK